MGPGSRPPLLLTSKGSLGELGRWLIEAGDRPVLAGIVLFSHGLPVDHSQLTLKGVGIHGMSLAVVACIFSLVGFESATTLGGEARNPLRNVPRAVIWSLILTGLFMVLLGYVEVFGTRHYGTSLASISAPLNVLAGIYHVSAFKIPVSIGAMVSFFSLTLSCLNAGSRIIFPYIFVGYIALGGGWLFTVSRRRRGILSDIETGLEQTLQQPHERRPAVWMPAPGEGAGHPGSVLGLIPDPAD